jgi:HD-GYP domain-containing protein (c-di-GMP phosphodiesterase class II)
LTSTLGLAALLHDIGKVRVPLEILTKPGKLTADEHEIMRRHPVYGAHLLRNLAGQNKLAMVVAFEHHANYDLSGYPQITTKNHPHLLARIVQVADAFDAATTSRRAYRKPATPEYAMSMVLGGAGTVFDPVVPAVLVRVLGVYPVGTVVELNTGDLGVVRRPGARDVTRPTVGVVRTGDGESDAPYEINLEDDGAPCIVRSRDPVDVGVDVAAHLWGS